MRVVKPSTLPAGGVQIGSGSQMSPPEVRTSRTHVPWEAHNSRAAKPGFLQKWAAIQKAASSQAHPPQVSPSKVRVI